MALIGAGMRGKQQTAWTTKTVTCDVDKKTGAEYQDYRKMLDEKGKEIDAVLIATPDHTHAVIAMEAIRRGKHVYCEKPLAHSIGEIRALGKAAKEHKVVTQLGNQGHSYESLRPVRRVDPRRGDRQGQGSALRPSRRGLGHQGHRQAERGAPDSGRPGLGPLDRPGPVSRLQPDVPSRTTGGTGRSSGPGPPATGSATSWTRRSGRWNSSTRRASR